MAIGLRDAADETFELQVCAAKSGHLLVTFRGHAYPVFKNDPYALPSSVIAAIATAYLLFILVLLVLLAP